VNSLAHSDLQLADQQRGRAWPAAVGYGAARWAVLACGAGSRRLWRRTFQAL